MIGSSRKILPALPQGSPASPILFLLYIEPLLKTIGPIPTRNRYSYADDLALLAISLSLERNVRLLEEELGLINQQAAKEGLSLDPKKTELLHFSRKRHTRNPALRAQLGLDLAVTEVKGCPIGTFFRWLGLYLDRRLSFKHHAAQMAARAQKVIQGLQILGNTVRGAPPSLAT